MIRNTYAHLNINPVEDWHHVNCGITHIIHPSFSSTRLLAFLLSVIVPSSPCLSAISLQCERLRSGTCVSPPHKPCFLRFTSRCTPVLLPFCYCNFTRICLHMQLLLPVSLCRRGFKTWVTQGVVKGYLVFSGKVRSRCFPTTVCSWSDTAVHLLQLCGGACSKVIPSTSMFCFF